MTTRLLTLLNVALIALAVSLPYGPVQNSVHAEDTAAAAQETEDVVYMRDGRVLRGKIASETRSLVVFEYFDSGLNIRTKITLLKSDIVEIERNVPAEGPIAIEPKPATTAPRPSRTSTTPEQPRTFGAVRVQDAGTEVPSFYIIPMRGQMGTDINSDIYRKIVNDVREMKPDVVIVKMFCQDTEDLVYSAKEAAERGLVEYDEYRTLVNIFRTDLREFRQVMWVEDSEGISSMVAMAWPEIYMMPNARFGGLTVAHTDSFNIPDPDVRGKMVAAVMGHIKSFLEFGGYSLVLADAMVQPQKILSASWKGREVQWYLDDRGEYLVDANRRKTAEFRAKTAEDFGISKGTAESLDDLALLLGYREYRLLESQAERLCADYVRDWRRAYEECKTHLQDYQQFMGWATGQDELKYLGRARQSLDRILNAMQRFKAVEIRMTAEFGMDRRYLTVMIEQIQERIRAIRSGGRGAGGSIGGGRGGGGGPSGL